MLSDGVQPCFRYLTVVKLSPKRSRSAMAAPRRNCSPSPFQRSVHELEPTSQNSQARVMALLPIRMTASPSSARLARHFQREGMPMMTSFRDATDHRPLRPRVRFGCDDEHRLWVAAA